MAKLRSKRGRKPGNKSVRRRGAAPGKLTPTGMTSTSGHIQAMATLRREQRKTKALELYDQGLTMDQIGAQLGVSGKTICLDLHEAFDELKAVNLSKAEHMRIAEVRRSHMRDRAVLPLLYGRVPGKKRVVGRGKSMRVIEEQPDPTVVVSAITRAHQRLTDSGRFRAELCGLNAPLKITPTDVTGDRRYQDLSEEELERIVMEKRAVLGLPSATNEGGA